MPKISSINFLYKKRCLWKQQWRSAEFQKQCCERQQGQSSGHTFNWIIVNNYVAPSISPHFLKYPPYELTLLECQNFKKKLFTFHCLRGRLCLFRITATSVIILKYLFCHFDRLLLRCYWVLILFAVVHFNSWLQIKWMLVLCDDFIN